MLQTLAQDTKHALNSLPPVAKKAYVKLMLDVIARSLVAASQNDLNIQDELKGFASGTTLEMLVLPNVARFKLQVNNNHQLTRVKSTTKADLSIKIKHLNLAFLLFTFQESTAVAYAHDRMIADGDLSDAIRFVRCLNRLEALILPKMVAKLAIKSYPELGIKQKLKLATSIYSGAALSLIRR